MHPFFFMNIMPEQQKRPSFTRPVTDEAILKTTKEIMVKFIEIGRVTPGNFEENYEKIFKTVKQSAEELHHDSAA
ncbi:Conjugal transfer protein TraB [Candidatus Electronema halotolerans]